MAGDSAERPSQRVVEFDDPGFDTGGGDHRRPDRTPAGSIEAIRYEFTNPDGEVSTRVWVDPATGRAVKIMEQLPAMMGGGTATAVLAPPREPGS